jgi:hypothetical protein
VSVPGGVVKTVVTSCARTAAGVVRSNAEKSAAMPAAGLVSAFIRLKKYFIKSDCITEGTFFCKFVDYAMAEVSLGMRMKDYWFLVELASERFLLSCEK